MIGAVDGWRPRQALQESEGSLHMVVTTSLRIEEEVTTLKISYLLKSLFPPSVSKFPPKPPPVCPPPSSWFPVSSFSSSSIRPSFVQHLAFLLSSPTDFILQLEWMSHTCLYRSFMSRNTIQTVWNHNSVFAWFDRLLNQITWCFGGCVRLRTVFIVWCFE